MRAKAHIFGPFDTYIFTKKMKLYEIPDWEMDLGDFQTRPRRQKPCPINQRTRFLKAVGDILVFSCVF